MARRPREHAEGHWYHAFNQGTGQQRIYWTDDDRRAFLALLRILVADFGVEIHAYCLMGNHFHLILRCPRNNISATMKYLSQQYTQQLNHHTNRVGALFRGRFESVAIIDDRHLLTEVRYVARNPLGLPNPPASLDAYRWSSHRAYLMLEPAPKWLTTSVVLAMLGGPGQYRRFVEQELATDKHPGPRSVLEIEAVVCALTGATKDALATSKRSVTNEPRLLFALGVAELTSSTVAQALGPAYGFATPAAARSTIKRARQRLETDPDFALLWQQVAA